MSKPAFPRQYSAQVQNETDVIVDQFWEQEGMSLLEYYAGQALVGLWASHSHPKSGIPTHSEDNFEGFSKACFDQADAMIKEAEKRSH